MNPPYVKPPPPSRGSAVVFPAQDERPCFRTYKYPFQVAGINYRPGIYYHFVKEEKDDEGNVASILVDLWFLSYLVILAITRTENGKEHGYLIEYIPHGETAEKRIILPQSLLLGRPDDALKTLRDHGISVLHKHSKLAREYLDQEHLSFSAKDPKDFWYSTKTVGWFSEKTFLLTNEIIGRRTGVCFHDFSQQGLYSKAGSFKEWRDHVAALCQGNDYLLLCLSCALLGPLLKWLNIPGAGVHLHGDSTTGKSSSLSVAVSTWSSPRFMLSWRGTTNGFEIQAANRSDTFIALDESHQADPKTLDAAIYMLLNGTAKARMNRDASAKEVQQWRPCILSTGEGSMESNLGVARLDLKAGQGVRILDVPVCAQYGIFNNLHGEKTGRQFADRLREACSQFYGHAGPLFIKLLIGRLPSLDLHDKCDRIYEIFGSDLSAQEARVARAFACIALAGELATEWQVVPWNPGDAKNAALRIFGYWQDAQPQSASSREHAQILKKIADFIDRHGDSRFSDINWVSMPGEDKEPVVHNRAGWWEDSNNQRMFLLTSGGLREATQGFDFNRVLRALDEAGAFFEKGSTERAKRRRTPDDRNLKLYHIDPAKLEPGS
jgi:putative DNA primase/helicase